MISARSKTSLHGSRFRARGTPKPSREEPVSKQERRMQIGILGSGLMGGKLGTVWARAGHEVVFSYSRGKEKLNKLARDARGKARAGTPSEAAKDADVLLLAVHWSRIDDVLKQAGDLSGKVIVSCSLPMNADDTDLVIAHTSSGAEELAKKAPKPARALGASVTFEPGARTAWHTHPLGQTLIVTAGCGRAQRWGGPIEEIRPG